jgi:hypothetical protein
MLNPLKKPFVFLIILFFLIQIKSNAQWLWAEKAGSTNVDVAYDIATDKSGYIYVTGLFNSNSIVFGTTTLSNAGSNDLFLVKYSPAGNVIWAKKAGGNDWDEANKVIVDAASNIYIVGYFKSDSIAFGSTVLVNTTSGFADIFIAKYDSSGKFLWAKGAGGVSDDYAFSICSDSVCNLFITGTFSNATVTFDTFSLPNMGSEDVFIAKYDSTGSVLWANSAGGSSFDYGLSVTSDNQGNAFINGTFESGSIVFGSLTLSNVGQGDMFTVKYNSIGAVVWAKSIGGILNDDGTAIATDKIGNVYVTGYYYSNSILIGSNLLTNRGMNDIMVIKFDSSGTVIWAYSGGGSDYDLPSSIAIDSLGSIFIGGEYRSSSIDFNGIIFSNFNEGNYDILLIKLDTAGSISWGNTAGGTDADAIHGIAFDSSGNIYAVGYFSSSSLNLGATTLTNAGSWDLFVAKLGSNTSITQLNKVNTTTLFPNPFNDKLNVLMNEKNEAEIILYDMHSRKILQHRFINSLSLCTGQLAKGVYIYEVRNKNGIIQNGKVVKE